MNKLLHFVMRADSVNDMQLEGMRLAMNRARDAHSTNIGMRINGKDEISEADWLKNLREVSARDVSVPVFYEAEESYCVHLCLDDRRVPREDASGKQYSLWGRVCRYIEMHRAEGALAERRPDADGWIIWNGGPCPLKAGVPFQLKFRVGGVTSVNFDAPTWRWSHDAHIEDIVAYRVAEGGTA